MGGAKAADNTIRFSPYLEVLHNHILDGGGVDSPIKSLVKVFNETIGMSPYGSIAAMDLNGAFFGDGYDIKSFPSMWDMFGKFMGGLDIHNLWNKVYEDTVQDSEINGAIAAHAAMLDDEIQSSVIPRFNAGMRDINAVMSSSYVTGRALIEDSRIKSVNKFAGDIRLKAIDLSADIWSKHLAWNAGVVSSYAELYKLYIAAKMDFDDSTMDFAVKDKLWDLSLFENIRSMLGALGGGTPTNNQSGPSKTQKAISGTLSGAAAGAMIGAQTGATYGGYWGAAIGGVVGLASSYL